MTSFSLDIFFLIHLFSSFSLGRYGCLNRLHIDTNELNLLSCPVYFTTTFLPPFLRSYPLAYLYHTDLLSLLSLLLVNYWLDHHDRSSMYILIDIYNLKPS